MGALIGGGLGLLGSSMQANAQQNAARASADAQRYAADKAAEEARFRPVGITTRWGKSDFQFDPEGRLSGAGYELSPELKAYQDRVMGITGRSLSEAELAPSRYAPLLGGSERLFNLGESYLGQSPEEVAQRYMLNQQNLLAPTRERQLAGLRNQNFQTGREGLSVGGTGLRPGGGMGLMASNPEMEAYYNAITQQDLGLAANAEQEARNQITFGGNLYNLAPTLLSNRTQGLVGGYSPFSTGLGISSTMETLGQSPLDIGAQLGGRTATAGANAGQFLYGGGINAARSLQPSMGLSPFGDSISGLSSNRQFTSGLEKMFSGSGNYQLGSNPWGSTGNEPPISIGQTYTSPYFAG